MYASIMLNGLITTTIFAAFFAYANALQEIPPSRYANCTQSIVAVTIAANNSQLLMNAPHNQSDITAFIFDFFAQGSDIPEKIGVRNTAVRTGTFDIWTQLCIPSNFTDGTVQLVIHGYV